MGKLTDEQKIDLVRRYKAGEGSVVLAKAFGIVPNSVLSLLEVRGIERRKAKKQ